MNSRWLAYVVLSALMTFGYACKGDGGGSSEDGFFQILETAPEDQQTEVPVEARIGFRADAAIDPDSLSTATFFLSDDEGTVVPASVAIGPEPEIVELIPDEPLAVITQFAATVTTDLLSTSGATLEEVFEWEFKTLDSEWGSSDWLEQINTGTSTQQTLVVDGQSNALAAWQYTEPAGSGIWANRYTRAELWGTPERIDGGDGNAINPRLATDSAGNGFVVWEQSVSATTANIWANRYAVDAGWGTPELLQTGEVTPARIPSIAADPAGNAIAIWVEQDVDTSEEVVWANRYEPAAGWGTAQPIQEMSTLIAGGRTSIGMDDDGNAIALWEWPTVGGGGLLWANRYTAGSGWGTAELVKADPETRIAGDFRLDVGPNGDAFVIWIQDDGTRQDVWSNRFTGTTWSTSQRIDSYNDGDKKEPDVAVDGTGVAHAVWSQADPDFSNFYNIYANQYTPGSGWGSTALLIEPPNEDPNEDGPAETPRIGVNAAGNAFVVWRQIWDGWGSIWSNRLDPGTGWMTAERIEDIARAARVPKIAVDENRHAHAVWLHSVGSGVDWVRTNRFE